MAASLKEVAARAGVSISTVSRVLNGKTYVNEETRQRVLTIMRQENFQPNAVAQSLKNGSSNTLALIVPSIQNAIFAPIARGAEAVARENGYTVFLANTYEDPAMEAEYIEMMRSRWTDGFIIASAVGSRQAIYALRDQGTPAVLVNRFDPEDEGRLSIISVDNFQAAYDGASRLIELGYRRIALAMGQRIHYFYRQRLEGYLQALQDHGLPADEKLILQERNDADDFYDQTLRAMQSENPPDVFFATSDPKALVILHALHAAGYEIPRDVGVLGFDNIDFSLLTEPGLSTVSQPLYDLGAEAARNVINQIQVKAAQGTLPPAAHLHLPHTLVMRGSLRESAAAQRDPSDGAG